MQKKETQPPFYEMEHTADKGLRAKGSSVEDLFMNMAAGMYHIIFGDIKKVWAKESDLPYPASPHMKGEGIEKADHIKPGQKNQSLNKIKIVRLKEASLTELLVSWLSELNFLLFVKYFLVKEIINLNIFRAENQYILKTKLIGNIGLKCKTLIKTEIKAVTYHQLKIEKIEKEYLGQVIFDV
jgi:SHS2 domain-containing protein